MAFLIISSELKNGKEWSNWIFEINAVEEEETLSPKTILIGNQIPKVKTIRDTLTTVEWSQKSNSNNNLLPKWLWKKKDHQSMSNPPKLDGDYKVHGMNGSSRAMVGDSFLNGEDHSELPERKQVSDPSPIFVAGFQTT